MGTMYVSFTCLKLIDKFIHLVTNLTKHISTKADQPMSAFMPNFIWCLRDFSLKLENEHGQELTESQYLESCLNFTIPQYASLSLELTFNCINLLESKTKDRTKRMPLENVSRLFFLAEIVHAL